MLQVQRLSPGRYGPFSTGVGLPVPTYSRFRSGSYGAGVPHLAAGGAAADRTRRAERRRAVEHPLRLAGLGVERLERAGQIVEVARHADDQVIADERAARWSTRSPSSQSAIIDVPLDLAVLRVERDQVRVRRRQEDRVLVNRRAAVADVEALVGVRIRVAPDLARRPRVDRPDVVGRRDVEHAVDQDRRGLDAATLTRTATPRRASAGERCRA